MAVDLLYENALVKIMAGNKEGFDYNQGALHALEELKTLLN